MIDVVGTPTVAFSATAVTSLQIARPENVQDGDLLVAAIRNQLSTAPTDIGLPENWQRRGTPFVANQSLGRSYGFYTRSVRQGEAANLPASFTFTGVSARWAGTVFRVSGADLDNPVAGFSPTYGGSPITNGARAESFSVAVNDCLQLALGGNEVTSPNETTSTVSAGFTQVVHVQSATGTTTSRTVLEVYKREADTPSSAPFDISWLVAGGMGAMSIAIRPGVFAPAEPETLSIVAKTAGGTEPGELWGYDGADLVPITKALWLPQSTFDLDDMFSEDTFYWAHRGGSANWLELSPQAYTNSVWHGAKCLEVSVHRSLDGVFVMSHDENTLRLTGIDKKIKDTTWAELSTLPATLNGQSGHLNRLEDYLDLPYARTHVTVIEDKSYSNMAAMLDLIESRIPDAIDRVMVKAFAGGGTSHMAVPNARGYESWGYYYAADVPSLPTTASFYTTLGLSHSASQADWDTINSYNKPVVGHIISTPAEAASALAKGADGLQCANVLTVIPKVNDLP